MQLVLPETISDASDSLGKAAGRQSLAEILILQTDGGYHSRLTVTSCVTQQQKQHIKHISTTYQQEN